MDPVPNLFSPNQSVDVSLPPKSRRAAFKYLTLRPDFSSSLFAPYSPFPPPHFSLLSDYHDFL